MNTMTLTTGIEVRWRPVPPYVGAKVLGSHEMLPPPTQTVSTPAGDQEIPVGEDTALYEQYIREMMEAEREQLEALTELTLDYGIVAWRKPPEKWWQRILASLHLAFCWYEDPPKNWTIPDVLEDIELSSSRRLDYIYVYLLADPRDYTEVITTIQSVTRDLTTGEVEAAETSFRAGEGRDGAAGPTVEPDQGTDDVRGDGGGEGVGADAE